MAGWSVSCCVAHLPLPVFSSASQAVLVSGERRARPLSLSLSLFLSALAVSNKRRSQAAIHQPGNNSDSPNGVLSTLNCRLQQEQLQSDVAGVVAVLKAPHGKQEANVQLCSSPASTTKHHHHFSSYPTATAATSSLVLSSPSSCSSILSMLVRDQLPPFTFTSPSSSYNIFYLQSTFILNRIDDSYIDHKLLYSNIYPKVSTMLSDTSHEASGQNLT